MKIDYIHVDSEDHYRALPIYNAYESYFPSDERRSKEQFFTLLKNPNVQVRSLLVDSKDLGYLILWPLSNCVFVEHFEIFDDFRNQSFGSKVLADLFKDYSKIVLECEPEDLNLDAKRRLSFYKKLGLEVVDKDYRQPAYGEDKNPLDLWLLSNYRHHDIKALKEEIYDVVYH